MSDGLFSGKPGLNIGRGLYRVVASLWSGSSGLVTDWDGAAPTGDMNVLNSSGTSYGVSFTVLASDGTPYVVTNSALAADGTPYAVI